MTHPQREATGPLAGHVLQPHQVDHLVHSASADAVGLRKCKQVVACGPTGVHRLGYSLLIEADGRRLFYSGDIRGHGRKSAMFGELLRRPPTAVDVMLMEGTHVRPDPAHDEAEFETEAALEDRFVDLCTSLRVPSRCSVRPRTSTGLSPCIGPRSAAVGS